jgi:hypothetical protein
MPEIANYDLDNAKRRLVTPQNLIELSLNRDTLFPILSADAFRKRVRVDDQDIDVYPDGISINETNFGVWEGPTATARGFNAFMNVGEPFVEERSDIIQPPPDVLSARSYENRSQGVARTFTDTIEFTISNSLTWSIEGAVDLPLTGTIHSEEQEETSASSTETVEAETSMTVTMHNHKDNIGTQTDNTVEASNTNSATTEASGYDMAYSQMSAALMLGLTGSLSGTVTTSWTSSSSVSGDIAPNTRVQTMATQRRQIRQYTYQMPVTFDGYVGLHYPQPVPMEAQPPQRNNQNSPEGVPSNYDHVIAVPIQKLQLHSPDRPYTAKGVAETVSTLGVDHVIFDEEDTPNRGEVFSDLNKHNLDPVPTGV